MKRVFIAALLASAMFVFCHRPAQAIAEFCPASLHLQAVAASAPQNVYGFDLGALGPRTLNSATLAFDTGTGWYTADVPTVTLSEKDRHYTSPSATFVRRDWVSPVMYLRFPKPVKIERAWVYRAAASGDGFAWQARGMVSCAPPSGADGARKGFHNNIIVEPKDEDALSAPPNAASIIVQAKPSQPLASRDCKEPFRYATADRMSQPEFPVGLRNVGGVTAVEVAINKDGSLADAWVWAPSGFQAFDNAALAAARNSTYKNARAYCSDVPGDYLFRVTFDPN